MSFVGAIQNNKVVSVTLNTAIDHVIKVEHLTKGSTIRALSDTMVPAGKGIDVAVGVATLGQRAVAAGFIGAESRDIFASLRHENVELLLLEVPGRTRTNVTVLERSGLRETHLQTIGYGISAADMDRLYDVLEGALTVGDVAVIAGSLPRDAPEGVVARLVTLCRERGAYVILDGSGRSLEDGLCGKPHMIKPNLLELAEITGCEADESDQGIARAAEQCRAAGVERVVVSCGRRGIVVVEQSVWKASVDIGRDRQTASVGSGDAVVAAFAAGTIAKWPVEQTIRVAVACAAANLLTELPGRFRVDDVISLLPRTVTQEVQIDPASG